MCINCSWVASSVHVASDAPLIGPCVDSGWKQSVATDPPHGTGILMRASVAIPVRRGGQEVEGSTAIPALTSLPALSGMFPLPQR